MRFADLGSVAQATVPGFYAWAATVAPTAWGRGSPFVAKLVALLGVAILVAAALGEGRSAKWARIASVWGLTLTSGLVWVVAPAVLAPTRIDVARGLSGMVGWALFAYASAAPAVRKAPPSRPRSDRPSTPLKPRAPVPRGDVYFVVGGVVLATALQVIGWRTLTPERALLVRLSTLAAGIALIDAATGIALARHKPRLPAPNPLRWRAALPWFATLVMLFLGGLLFHLMR